MQKKRQEKKNKGLTGNIGLNQSFELKLVAKVRSGEDNSTSNVKSMRVTRV